MKFSIAFLSILFLISCPAAFGQQTKGAAGFSAPERHTGAVPQKALDVYNYVVLHGKAPAGYVGGSIWYNRERHLPKGHYHEFDVNPKQKGVNRGAERVVIDFDTNNAWYTSDHYRTFVPIPSTHHKGPQDEQHPGFHTH